MTNELIKQLNCFGKIISWLLTPRYNCKKGKHRWESILPERGKTHLYENGSGPFLRCLDCEAKTLIYEPNQPGGLTYSQILANIDTTIPGGGALEHKPLSKAVYLVENEEWNDV